MAKKALSITLDESNLLWLKGWARVRAGNNLSAAVDRLIAEARAGTLGAAETPRSVAGTIAVPDDIISCLPAPSRRSDVHERPAARRQPRRKQP